MYSTVFVTKISAAARSPRAPYRASFTPSRSRRRHFLHNFRPARSSPFDSSRVSHQLLDICINVYTRPVPGVHVHRHPSPDLTDRHRTCVLIPCGPNRVRCGRASRNHRRLRGRRNRRSYRSFYNRRYATYPEGSFCEHRQRAPRVFPPHFNTSARNRRRARRSRRDSASLPSSSRSRPSSASTTSAVSQVHNLPLCLSLSLLVSCADMS